MVNNAMYLNVTEGSPIWILNMFAQDVVIVLKMVVYVNTVTQVRFVHYRHATEHQPMILKFVTDMDIVLK